MPSAPHPIVLTNPRISTFPPPAAASCHRSAADSKATPSRASGGVPTQTAECPRWTRPLPTTSRRRRTPHHPLPRRRHREHPLRRRRRSRYRRRSRRCRRRASAPLGHAPNSSGWSSRTAALAHGGPTTGAPLPYAAAAASNGERGSNHFADGCRAWTAVRRGRRRPGVVLFFRIGSGGAAEGWSGAWSTSHSRKRWDGAPALAAVVEQQTLPPSQLQTLR